MNYMQRLLTLAASVVLAAALLAGCGSAPAASSGEASVSSEAASAASGAAAADSAAASAASDAMPAASDETAASSDAAAAPAGAVQCVFTVTYADGAGEEFALQAQDGATLADALRDAGLISEEEAAAGFVTTVNGVTADWDKDGAWWCLTDASGEMTAVGIADIALHDGDSYAFTYTTG